MTMEITPEEGEDVCKRCAKAIAIGATYGAIDGDHHKMWVIDQMMRALLGPSYEDYVRGWCAGEDGPDTYSWDEGVAP